MNKGHEAFWGSGPQVGESHGRDGEGVAGEERGAPEGVGQLEYWNNGTKDGGREMKREIIGLLDDIIRPCHGAKNCQRKTKTTS